MREGDDVIDLEPDRACATMAVGGLESTAKVITVVDVPLHRLGRAARILGRLWLRSSPGSALRLPKLGVIVLQIEVVDVV
jgi:hypothetical protein